MKKQKETKLVKLPSEWGADAQYPMKWLQNHLDILSLFPGINLERDNLIKFEFMSDGSTYKSSPSGGIHFKVSSHKVNKKGALKSNKSGEIDLVALEDKLKAFAILYKEARESTDLRKSLGDIALHVIQTEKALLLSALTKRYPAMDLNVNSFRDIVSFTYNGIDVEMEPYIDFSPSNISFTFVWKFSLKFRGSIKDFNQIDFLSFAKDMGNWLDSTPRKHDM